jgi:hypothetical protein
MLLFLAAEVSRYFFSTLRISPQRQSTYLLAKYQLLQLPRQHRIYFFLLIIHTSIAAQQRHHRLAVPYHSLLRLRRDALGCGFLLFVVLSWEEVSKMGVFNEEGGGGGDFGGVGVYGYR